MGMLRVTLDGREFRYYDNGGAVMTTDGGEAIIVGMLDEGELDVYRFDTDEERQRSDEMVAGRVRGVALSWINREYRGQA